MRYMLFVRVGEEVQLSPEERRGIPAAVDSWVAMTEERGLRLLGCELSGGADARTVRVRSGVSAIQNGTPDQDDEPITGFDILECKDLAEAVDVAEAHPVAAFGTIELRPFGDS